MSQEHSFLSRLITAAGQFSVADIRRDITNIAVSVKQLATALTKVHAVLESHRAAIEELYEGYGTIISTLNEQKAALSSPDKIVAKKETKPN